MNVDVFTARSTHDVAVVDRHNVFQTYGTLGRTTLPTQPLHHPKILVCPVGLAVGAMNCLI